MLFKHLLNIIYIHKSVYNIYTVQIKNVYSVRNDITEQDGILYKIAD